MNNNIMLQQKLVFGKTTVSLLLPLEQSVGTIIINRIMSNTIVMHCYECVYEQHNNKLLII